MRYNECLGYWLASPSGNSGNESVIVRSNGRISYEYSYGARTYTASREGNYMYALRPVVCLPTGIELEEDDDDSNLYNITMGGDLD